MAGIVLARWVPERIASGARRSLRYLFVPRREPFGTLNYCPLEILLDGSDLSPAFDVWGGGQVASLILRPRCPQTCRHDITLWARPKPPALADSGASRIVRARNLHKLSLEYQHGPGSKGESVGFALVVRECVASLGTVSLTGHCAECCSDLVDTRWGSEHRAPSVVSG